MPLKKIDKHTWQAAALPSGSTLHVRMQVYAWDLSVRGAHLDDSHGFFNGACVFLQVQGQTDLEQIATGWGVNVLWLSGKPVPTRSWNTNGRCCTPASNWASARGKPSPWATVPMTCR